MTELEKLICDGNTLWEAFRAAQKSSAWKPQVQAFEINLLDELVRLQKELLERTYKTSQKMEFMLNERGKVRLIRGAQIRDRVVRHALCDAVLNPILSRKLIYDNCASIKGKGIHMSRNRLKVHLHRYYRKHKTNEGYILLMDFSGFFDNLRHDLLIKSVEKHIKDDFVLWLLKLVIKDFEQDVSFLPDEEIDKLYHGKFKALDYAKVPKKLKTGKKFLRKSVDIGDQCSQILGIYYPTPIDNYIKIVCGEKYYGRYMDDSYLISPSKERLIEILIHVKAMAKEMGLILNDKKIKILPISKTFRYLQNKYFLTETGRVVERANPKRISAMCRKLKKLAVKVQEGKLPLEDVVNTFQSWKGNYYRIMSKAQRKQMDEHFNELFKKKGGRQNETV